MGKRHVMKLLITVMVVLAYTPGFCKNNGNTSQFVEGSTAFCFDLYRNLKKIDGNLFFSPYSISIAMGVNYAGAKGETEREIAKTLHFNPDRKIFFSELKDVQVRLNSLSADGYLKLQIANSIWAQEGNRFLDSFTELNGRYFGSKLKNVDFINHADDAILHVNNWVRDNTRGKIDEMLGPDVITDLTKIILCNVVYMKGIWAKKFSEEDTEPASFYLAPWKHAEIPMMNQTDDFRYREFGDFRAIELPYLTGKKSFRSIYGLSMILLLPESKKGLPKLENSLNRKNISEWIDELMGASFKHVKVRIPKFISTSEFELSEILAGMGMPGVFGHGADFSGIFGKKEIFFDTFIHKTFMEINEEGTEATASSDEEFYLGGPSINPKPKKFYADHPFIFLIRDNESGSILFFGRVTDPSI